MRRGVAVLVVLGAFAVPALWPGAAPVDAASLEAVTVRVRVGGDDALLVVHEVPEDALPGLSTRDLLAAVLDHPLVGELLDSGPVQARVVAFRHRSEAFVELLDRPDAAAEVATLVEAVRTHGWPPGTRAPDARAAVLGVVASAL